MNRSFFKKYIWLLGVLGLSSCAKLGLGGKPAQPEPRSPFGATGIPPQLRSRTAATAAAGTPVVAGGNVTADQPGPKLTPREDIIYTDPDDPDAVVEDLSELLAKAKAVRGPWEQSETLAKQRAAREGKPLLIWFTDSEGSQLCNALRQELFGTPDFSSWANEKLVRLKVDAAAAEVSDPDMDLGSSIDRRIRVMNYNAEIKKRYKVMGYPSMVMVSPSGAVVGRYRGFKRGGAEYLWGQLKHAEGVSCEGTRAWRQELGKKGYREWRDRNQRKVFAKLTSYQKGTLTLIEPDGSRSRTTEEKLCDEDRGWIAEQKRQRNLQ